MLRSPVKLRTSVVCKNCGRMFFTWPSLPRSYCNLACFGKKISVPRIPIEERFWAKVEKTDACWEWQSRIAPATGYGNFAIWKQGRRTTWLAHRLAWFLTNGAIPKGLCVLHKCDNRRCVRPDHLFLGTAADNVHDCIAKGRFPKNRTPRGNVSMLACSPQGR